MTWKIPKLSEHEQKMNLYESLVEDFCQMESDSHGNMTPELRDELDELADEIREMEDDLDLHDNERYFPR